MRLFWGLVLAPLLLAQSHNQLTPAEKNAGWILLFDGSTFNGWQDPHTMKPAGDAWSIDKGTLKANHSPRIREDLLTTQTFGDFDLIFDWRISAKGNSGVKYRVEDTVYLVKGKTHGTPFEKTVDYEYAHRLGVRSKLGPEDHVEAYPIAFEYQVIDNAGHPDALRGGKQTSGALYSMIAPSQQTSNPAGEWNHSRIVLKGNHVEHWLNDVKVVDTDLNVPEIEQGLASRWGKESPVYKLLMNQPKKSTPVALQNHNDEAWFRDIKIRPL